MLEDHEAGDERARREEWDDRAHAVRAVGGERCDQHGAGHDDGCDHRREAHHAEEQDKHRPDDEREHGREGEHGPHGRERAEARRDALAALEADPWRERVSDDRRCADGEPAPRSLCGDTARSRTEHAEDPAACEHGDGALQRIEEEAGDAPRLAERASEVGGAVALAADGAEIDAAGPCEQVRGGHAADEVGGDGHRRPKEWRRIHRGDDTRSLRGGVIRPARAGNRTSRGAIGPSRDAPRWRRRGGSAAGCRRRARCDPRRARRSVAERLGAPPSPRRRRG